MEKVEIELWLAVNDEGSHAVSFDGAKDAIATLLDEHGGAAVRTVKMSVSVELPPSLEVDHIEIVKEDGDEAKIEIDEGDEYVELPAEGDKGQPPINQPHPESAAVTA
jgi:hypothetical protein